jgi:hypothetical protein
MATTPLQPLQPIPGGEVLNAPPEINGVWVGTFGQIIAEANQVRFVTLTAAQLLGLKAGGGLQLAPVPLKNILPGAGLALVLDNVSVRVNFKTTAYTLNAGTLKVYLGPPANAVPVSADLSSILTQAATSDLIGSPGLATAAILQALAENVPLYIGNTGAAEFTLGDGTLDIVITYNVVQM